VLQIEALIRRVEELGDQAERERTRALVAAVLELHGRALSLIVEELRRAGGEASLRELARDDAVSCVLSLHDLYEAAPEVPAPARAPGRAEDLAAKDFVPIERLRARRPPVQPDEEHERCDLCSAALGERHDHLIDPQVRDLRCACQACASLFAQTGPIEGRRWKRVRYRADRLDSFRLGDDSWAALGIPIELAFFFRSSRDERVVAMYPSPAGATESLLSLDAWTRVEDENPVLRDLEPDVEALLVRRGRGAREHYRVSIDACYALVGRIRAHWRGLGGGTEVWVQIGAFFDELRTATQPGLMPPTPPTPRSLHA
jgi:uncharacterized protein DUF5947